MPISQKHIDIIQRRINYLSDKIDKCDGECGHEKAERSAMQSLLSYCVDENNNLVETKAFKKGQYVILKNYKKYLENIIWSNDMSKVEILLSRTKEWLKDSEQRFL